jgi:nuclear pore complex protein Nup54
VDAGTVGQYGRPAGATDETKWKQAVRDNPEPSTYVVIRAAEEMLTKIRMVPVLATGWEDVKKRSQMQEAIASVHQQRVKVSSVSGQTRKGNAELYIRKLP